MSVFANEAIDWSRFYVQTLRGQHTQKHQGLASALTQIQKLKITTQQTTEQLLDTVSA